MNAGLLMPCQGKRRGPYAGDKPTSPQALGVVLEGPSRRQPDRCALAAVAGDAHPSLGRRCQDQPIALPLDTNTSLTCPMAMRELAAKAPSTFQAHNLSGGRQCHQRKCGYGVGTPSQLSSSAISVLCWPGRGPPAPRSPLRRSRSLDRCINLLQKHPAPCPDHRPARLSHFYHNPPFVLCLHPLSLCDCWEGMGSPPAPWEVPSPLAWPGKLISSARRRVHVR